MGKPVQQVQYTLKWDTTDAHSYEGKEKTRIFHDEESLRIRANMIKADPHYRNVRAFKLITTIRKEDIDLG